VPNEAALERTGDAFTFGNPSKDTYPPQRKAESMDKGTQVLCMVPFCFVNSRRVVVLEASRIRYIGALQVTLK